jgi:hypothetical protein
VKDELLKLTKLECKMLLSWVEPNKAADVELLNIKRSENPHFINSNEVEVKRAWDALILKLKRNLK